MVLAAGFPEIRKGIKWIGENGWIWCDKDGLEANPPAVLKEHIGPDETHLYKSTDHYQNFLDCVKTRRQTISPCETAHRSASVGHLGNIAMELERRIRFDPETETILDDPEASRLLGRAYRKPWQLDF